jgi:ATP-binding cassette subfamily B protein/subfamily B ATP-binding cassette protein MsbA
VAKKHSAQTLNVFRLCRWALGYALRRWPPLAAVALTMLVKIGLDLLKPWPMVFLVDHVLRGKTRPAYTRILESLPGPHSPANLIAWCVGATVLIFLLSWALGLANAYANINLGQRMVYDLAADLFAKLQRLSLRFHASQSVGDNIRRVTADSACVATIVKDALLPVIFSVVRLASMFGILWGVDPTLTLVALAVVPWMALILRLYAQPMLDRSYQQQTVEGKIYEIVEQTFAAIPAVQAFGREELNELRFRAATGDTVAATLALTKVQVQFKMLIGLATAAGTAGIVWFGARHALQANAVQGAVGDILLFLSYLTSFYEPLEAAVYTGSTIQGAAGSARRVWEILESEREVLDKPGAVPLASSRGHVQLENVSFGYEINRPILRHISLEIRPCETMALVGATGAGKTTLAGLIPRFFDPWEGRVAVDGMDLREVQLKSLRTQIAIVLQEPFLFPLSVAENIAYGRPAATLAEIEAAARAARAHEFIQRLPDSYHTVIGERGTTLSVGERQRLSIARAFLKNAPILILDEPTSALDVETESLLLQALEQLTKDRTTLIIAHRLSTIRRADRIVVLQEGRVVEAGTHGELLARGQVYAHFHAIQFGAPTATAEGGRR